jgi:hypothetical protein
LPSISYWKGGYGRWVQVVSCPPLTSSTPPAAVFEPLPPSSLEVQADRRTSPAVAVVAARTRVRRPRSVFTGASCQGTVSSDYKERFEGLKPNRWSRGRPA